MGNSVYVIYPFSREELNSPIARVVAVPGSKSHTIRALLLAVLSQGVTRIINPLYSQDTESCIRVVENWGAKVMVHDTFWEVDAADVKQFLAPRESCVDVGNSGTTVFFATALAAVSSAPLTFDGDASLRTRTAQPLLAALAELGAHVEDSNNGCVPYTVHGPIHAGSVRIKCPTSQYASALLYALSCIEGQSEIYPELAGEHPYVDMTIEWLRHYGAVIQNDNYERIRILKGLKMPAPNRSPVHISGDFSSASFFFAIPAVTGARITVHGLTPHDTQADKQVLHVLERMGVSHEWNGNEQQGFTVTLSRERPLRGGEFDLSAIPDALPVLSVCSSYANERVRFYNVAHARAKETDRIAVMAAELSRLGVHTEEHSDGLTVHPGKSGLSGGIVDSHHDHRIAMAFAVGALGASAPVSVKNAHVAAVTFPAFYKLLSSIGANIEKS